MSDKPAHPRRWYQFRLSTILIVTAIFAVVFAAFASGLVWQVLFELGLIYAEPMRTIE